MRDNDTPPAPAGTIPVLVGRTNSLVRTLVTRGDLSLEGLLPGQGLIAAVRSPLGTGEALAVVGGDDKGTLAAATVMAARLPRLWNMTGITLKGVADQVRQYLGREGLSPLSVAVTALVVDSDRRGIREVRVRAATSSNRVARTVSALQSLDAAHRRGLEPQTLNFAEVAIVTVDVGNGTQPAARATVTRAGLNGRTLTPPIDPNELATDSPGDRGRPADGAAASRGGKTFDLSNPYSIEGWFGDGYTDLIPDRTDTVVIAGDGGRCPGCRARSPRGWASKPRASRSRSPRRPTRCATPPASRIPILVGRDNRLVQELVKIGRARLDDLRPGEGVVQIVPKAFGDVTATVVAGADPAGTAAAAQYLGRRVPYVWDTRRGALSFGDVRTELSKFLGGKSAAGQAAQAVRELDQIVADLRAQDEVGDVVRRDAVARGGRPWARCLPDQATRSRLEGREGHGAEPRRSPRRPRCIDETLEVPWEVDEFWTRLRADVLPKVTAGATVDARGATQRVARIPADARRPGDGRADQGRCRARRRSESCRPTSRAICG